MALTPESIAETWNNGGTVQIGTPEDYNVFIEYLNSNPTSETMRNAEVTADLDFEDGEIEAAFFSAQISNITLNGNGHTISGIVQTVNNNILFFFGNGDNSVLKNIKYNRCYIQSTSGSQSGLISAGSVNNVQVKNSRFIIASQYYTGLTAHDILYYSCAATIYINIANFAGYYYGIDNRLGTVETRSVKYCALLDSVYRSSSSYGDEAVAIYLLGGSASMIYTRNRFFNFRSVQGIYVYYNTSVSNVYVAVTAQNATTIQPFRGQLPTAGYYDKTLVPNAASYTQAGLTTEELQSVATMTEKGFNVEAVGS